MSTIVDRIIESSTYGEHNLKVVFAGVIFLGWLACIFKKALVVYRVIRYITGKNKSDTVIYNIPSSVPVTCKDLKILTYRHCLQAIDAFAGFERPDESFAALPKKIFPHVDVSLITPTSSNISPSFHLNRTNPVLRIATDINEDNSSSKQNKQYSDIQNFGVLGDQISNTFPMYPNNELNSGVMTSAYVGISIDANLLLSNIIRFSSLREKIQSDVNELYAKFIMIILLPPIFIEWISCIKNKIWFQSIPVDIDTLQGRRTSLTNRDGIRNRLDQQLEIRETDTITTPLRGDFYPEISVDSINNSSMDPFTCIIEQCNFINGLNLTDKETELQLPVSMDFHSDVDSIPYIILLKNKRIDSYTEINKYAINERTTKNIRNDFPTGDVTGTLFICSEQKIQKILLIANNRIYNPLKVFGSHTDSEEGQCIGCYTYLRSVIITPCGHCCLCENCAMKCRHVDKKCPMCRMEILNYIILPVIEN